MEDYGLDEAIAESLRAVGAASDGDGHEHGEHHDHDHGHGCEGAHAAEADVRETKEQQAGEPAAAGPAVAPEAPEADYAQTARLLREILRNILREPDVAKFRRIKLDTLALRLQLAGCCALRSAAYQRDES